MAPLTPFTQEDINSFSIILLGIAMLIHMRRSSK